jgi:PIN domain nuclease of toxin-antitoxin system
MNYLLDSHILLWWIFSDKRLSENTKNLMASPGNALYWSAASSWEISIKYQLGKLELKYPPEKMIPEHLRINNINTLPIRDEHAFLAGRLPDIHRDPFDRMLAAQAIIERLKIISSDNVFSKYEVSTIT